MNEKKTVLENLYNRITDDEDARVCKDIPDAACNDQPRNFFAYMVANLLGKVADEIASAKLIIPWLFGILGVPPLFAGFLVPIRESGVLLPQLAVAAFIRGMPIRKYVWLAGAFLSSISLFIMAYAAIKLDGVSAGCAIIFMLIVFSLSRGLCSVAAKDVLGKTVSKSRRGILMGWSASISGVAVLLIGFWLSKLNFNENGIRIFAKLLIAGGITWIFAFICFAAILEQPGATDGGGNSLSVALQQIKILRTDRAFRSFVIARGLMLSVALAPPFYVLIAQSSSKENMLGLSSLFIANGLAGSLSAPFWGYMGDKSSKRVMVTAAAGAGIIGIFTFFAVTADFSFVINETGLAVIFLIFNIMHGGLRLGRKVYLVDMATSENRAAYVALSNTIIGVLMLAGGMIGLIADKLGAPATVLVLGIGSLFAAFYVNLLPDVSESA